MCWTSGAFWVEALVVGISAVVVGLVISYLMMGDKARKFEHWQGVALTFFLTGGLLHLLYELAGWNGWYCRHGHACLLAAASPSPRKRA